MRIQSHRRSHGFSLIEVMIAVVVLATGMLALASLQAKLASNSADAKARSRVAALLTSVLDDQRASGYAGVAAFGSTSCLATGISLEKAICTAESDAGISGLTLKQTVVQYYGVSGGGAFTTTVPAAGTTYADYKLVTLTAQWKDVTNTQRTLVATNIASALNITGSSTFLDTSLTASKMSPAVHEENPALTAGVIPIAVGANTDAASTNPLPTIDKALTSTTFTTLTYTQGGLDTSISRTIQKRVETTVAECACRMTTSGTSPIVYTSGSLKGQKDVFLGTTMYRPTYWDGTQYVSPVDLKLTPYSAQHPDMVGSQNDLCTIVCRDHHDKNEVTNLDTTDTVLYDSTSPRVYTTSTGSKFDRFDRYQVTVTPGNGNAAATITYSKDADNYLVPTTNTKLDYIDAARLIRVGGIWRVATDMHAEHMGLLATAPKGFATTSTPDSSAESGYEKFVIDYMGQRLKQVLASGSAPAGNSLFASYGLDDPATINATTVSGDYRYLHGRGLYLDALEQPAIDKLKSVYSQCAVSDFPTCLLPYLPFNTINVTQLEGWAAKSATQSTTGKISVTNSTTSNNASACVPGGKTPTIIRACVSGSSAGSDSAIASMNKSNSAVAASSPVSPYEQDPVNLLKDTQDFNVTGSSTASEYFVNVESVSTTLPNGTDLAFWTDDLSTTNDPTLQWLIGSASDYCFANVGRTDTNPNPYDCVTTLPLSPSLQTTVGNYNQVVQQQIGNPCSGGTGSYSQPVLVCYTVKTVSISGVTGYTPTWTAPTTDVKTTAEQTVITIPAATPIPKGQATLNVTLVPNGTAVGSYTCDAVTNVPTFTTPTTCN